jgi:hypothetical protein
MPLSNRGKTSPSFLLAMFAVVLGVVGVSGWRYFRPNPLKRSEMIVRESRRTLNAGVRHFERELGDLMKKSGVPPAERIAAIEKLAAESKREVDNAVDAVRAELAELDIPLRTHQNRSDRIDERADEAKAMIDERVSEKREQLSGG